MKGLNIAIRFLIIFRGNLVAAFRTSTILDPSVSWRSSSQSDSCDPKRREKERRSAKAGGVVLTTDDKSHLPTSRDESVAVCVDTAKDQLRQLSYESSGRRRPLKKRARRTPIVWGVNCIPSYSVHTRGASVFSPANTKVHSRELGTREIPLGALACYVY